MVKMYSCAYIWLKYSRKTIRRSVYANNGHYYIKLGGDLVEVEQTNGGSQFVTIGEF